MLKAAPFSLGGGDREEAGGKSSVVGVGVIVGDGAERRVCSQG